MDENNGGVSVVSLIVKLIYRSKCTHIECCCIKIDRDIENELKDKKSRTTDFNNNNIKISSIFYYFLR